MKLSTRVLGTGVLAAAIVTALSAFAATYTHPASIPMTAIGTVATSRVAASSMTTAMATASSAKPGRTVSLPPLAKQSSYNRFIVKYKTGSAATRSSDNVLNAVNAAAMRAGVAGMALQNDGKRTALSLKYLRKLSVGADLVRLSRNLNQAEADALLAQLRADPSVEYAQPDYVMQALSFMPNDTYYGLQWHYSDPTAGIQAPDAWDISTGAGVVVAVIDTGYLDHADLNANILPGYDFIDDLAVAGDGDGRDADAHDPGDWTDYSDSSFHGTHVAGTVAAVTNNAKGVAGIAFNAKVQPVRVLGHGGGYTSDIADGIIWASGGSVNGVPANTTPAEVINMSLGGGWVCSTDPVMQGAIDSANSRGTIVVVAAGNSDDDVQNYSPAGCKGVVAVGASGIDGARSYFSNFGGGVTVSAPGGNATSGSDPDDRWIWSLGNTGSQQPVASPGGDAIVGMIGTSMASPHVAGVVAQMQSAAVASGHPPLTMVQVKNVLRATATPWTVLPPVSKPQGPGIINAAAAVYAATQAIPPTQGILLANRIAETGQTGTAGESILYKFVVPAGKTSLNLRTYGGTGDVSIYMARARIPTTSDYDLKSVKPGNNEAVFVTKPAAGNYYLLVVGETAFTDLSVLGMD
ncbi:S8 family peptidase [Lysobacter rhizosphaerae]